MSTDPIVTGDSAIFETSLVQPKILEVLQTGKLVVVGFGNQSVPDDICLAAYRDQIRELIAEHNCTEFAFDLAPFKIIASGTLGLIASVLNEGVKVYVFNVHPKVWEVFQLTNLDQAIEMSDPRNPQ
jgi:anti-sigma B factor antagonist